MQRLQTFLDGSPYAIKPLSVCLSCLSVCNVRALWPNGWTYQDETWRAGRPRPWPHCVRWGPSFPSPKGHSPPFSAHIYCGQMAGWMNTPLGMELDLCPCHTVSHGVPALREGGTSAPPLFGPCLLWPRSPISATAELLSLYALSHAPYSPLWKT